MRSRVLIVDPDPKMRSSLGNALRSVARISSCTTFPAARRKLRQQRYALVVANLRLRGFNGVHLAYLAPEGTRTVVYASSLDLSLAREVREAGAVYEVRDDLPARIAGYLQRQLSAGS